MQKELNRYSYLEFRDTAVDAVDAVDATDAADAADAAVAMFTGAQFTSVTGRTYDSIM